MYEACKAQLAETKEEMLWIGAFMILLSAALSVVLTYVTVRVKQMVWKEDKVIPLMLGLMCLTMYSTVLYFLFENVLFFTCMQTAYCRLLAQEASYGFVIFECFLRTNQSFFLGIGAMLNLNKWVYFNLKIGSIVAIGEALVDLDQIDRQTIDDDVVDHRINLTERLTVSDTPRSGQLKENESSDGEGAEALFQQHLIEVAEPRDFEPVTIFNEEKQKLEKQN